MKFGFYMKFCYLEPGSQVWNQFVLSFRVSQFVLDLEHFGYVVDGKTVASILLEDVWDQVFTCFWHNLYIRRLPGRSHRLVLGF